MRTRIASLQLRGTNRSVEFAPGLNIITGPIASGKTTMLRFCRSLLGGSFSDMPPEARGAVDAVVGGLLLGHLNVVVARPAVTTANAIVDVSGPDVALRLPAYRGAAGEKTYVQWLSDSLGLPRIDVPSRPTQPESEPTPVTFNDYMLYCTLWQQDIGDSVFGHREPFKNIKRRYVFEIIYGLHSLEAARLQEELRDVLAQLRELKSRGALFARFFEDTPMENRAEVERQLALARRDLEQATATAVDASAQSREDPEVRRVREQLLESRERMGKASEALRAERRGIDELARLSAQLDTQASRLTRSIVANKHLTDIEFVVCPRCGADLDLSRGSDDECYLCLQTPRLDFSRDILVKEQARVDAQLVEASELNAIRQGRVAELEKTVAELQSQGARLAQELDFLTSAFVSARADEIASTAERRASAQARVKQFEGYLSVFAKMDTERQLAETLQRQKDQLEAELESLGDRSAEVDTRIRFLEEKFDELVERLHPPEFGEEARCTIDRRTYMPIFRGRRFDELSSPGLGTLVNVAHALAHHITSLEFNLGLPGILLLDGVSEHFGQGGEDPERQRAIYEVLLEIASERGEDLQIIVADNDIPRSAHDFVKLELTEEDRLVPQK